MVIAPSPQGLGAQSARANSHELETSLRPAAKRPTCTQSEMETAPLPVKRGETSALNPLQALPVVTITVKRWVALKLGVPSSVTVTTIRLVVEACARVG